MNSELEDRGVNPSRNPALSDLVVGRRSRRQILHGGLAAAAVTFFGSARPPRALAQSGRPLVGFTGVPPSRTDAVVVPPGYTAEVLYAWGDPISEGTAFKPDASNTAAEQEQQAGMHHDGLHFFPLPAGSQNGSRGLLAVKHEYTDDGLLHVGGMQPWTVEKVAKSQAAHGVSVIEVARANGSWTVVRGVAPPRGWGGMEGRRAPSISTGKVG